MLVVLQGIDAAGKDGTIRHVMSAFNPQGCPVTAFKVPSAEELAHDFLWRIHRRVPGKGEIGVFNRSHYEDVLVVRVHDLVPKDVWSARYDQINAFERHLDRQRHDDHQVLPVHRQGRAAGAVPGALRRPDQALEVLARRPRGAEALGRLHRRLRGRPVEDARPTAPWYVIPANRKWFRNLAVATILADTLEELDPRYPEPEDLAAVVVE